MVGVGESATAELRAEDLRFDGSTSSFMVVDRGRRLGEVTLRIPGRHYVLDALAALAAGLRLGFSFSDLRRGLEAFSGTRRRMELKGEVGGIRVYDSYAHHPNEIAGDLQAARSLAGEGRVVVAFQPHLVSRTKIFGPAMGEALGAADEVVVMDVYVAREDPEPGVNGELVASHVPLPPEHVHFQPSWSLTPGDLVDRAREGDVVLTLGAGDVTLVGPGGARAAPRADGGRSMSLFTRNGPTVEPDDERREDRPARAPTVRASAVGPPLARVAAGRRRRRCCSRWSRRPAGWCSSRRCSRCPACRSPGAGCCPRTSCAGPRRCRWAPPSRPSTWTRSRPASTSSRRSRASTSPGPGRTGSASTSPSGPPSPWCRAAPVPRCAAWTARACCSGSSRPSPHALPMLRMGDRTGTEALAEAAAVAGSLPVGLARKVRYVEVRTVDTISLELRSGKQVRWGSADDSADKARVLERLLGVKASFYDVSVPGQPIIRR